LKEADLGYQDLGKIEKILKEKGLVSVIVPKGTPESQLFEDYITGFWNYDRSPYVEEKLSHKLRIGKTHCKLSLERAKLHWIPFFKGKTLGEITRQDLKEFSKQLAMTAMATPNQSEQREALTVGVALHQAVTNALRYPSLVLPA
jgi:hypothetical protein